MFFDLIRYGVHRIARTGTVRLAMTILVKNESDIIEDNIRVHAHLGVDCFIVMDNGSDDGTREILERLKREYEIEIIDQPEQTYRQRQWMTQLAFHARDRHGADWVISNDADEFWIPESGDLKQGLDRAGSLITCQRFNMVLVEGSERIGYRYFSSQYRVNHPIDYSKAALQHGQNVSIPFAKISKKVMVNPYGLLRMKGGNHRASHIATLWSQRRSSTITVYHYPIRSYSRFEQNIRNRRQLFAANPGVSMGPHYRRWVELLETGALEREYDRFVVSDNEIPVLERFGIIQRDPKPSQAITAALNISPSTK